MSNFDGCDYRLILEKIVDNLSMDIENRLIELLYFKDCVVVPGFGGFVSQYIPARIKEETQTFIPPSKEIGFNKNLIQDDGLLSAYLANYNKITVSEARVLIDRYIDQLRKKLSAGEQVFITSIGYFNYTRTGELIFSATKDINFLAESYGLSSFHYTRTGQEDHPLLRSSITKPRESRGVVSLPGTETRLAPSRAIRRVAMAIPLLLVISLLPLNSRRGHHQGQQVATLFPMPGVSGEVVTIDSDEKNSEEIPASKIDSPSDTEAPKENKAGKIKAKEIEKASFAIIAGSFSAEKNALVLKNNLVEKGFNPEIWKAENGFFRVVIEALDNMTRAQEAVIKLREELSDIDFWILK